MVLLWLLIGLLIVTCSLLLFKAININRSNFASVNLNVGAHMGTLTDFTQITIDMDYIDRIKLTKSTLTITFKLVLTTSR